MITGMQIRASRAALRWSAEVLAARAGVGVQTIKRLEAADRGRATTLQDVQQALEVAGIEFIGTPTDRPGIRLSATWPDAKCILSCNIMLPSYY